MKPEELLAIIASTPPLSTKNHPVQHWVNPTKKVKEVSKKQRNQSKKSRKINRRK